MSIRPITCGFIPAFLFMAVACSNGAPSAVNPSGDGITPGIELEEIASGLEYPWGMAFLPGGDMLVTEREGRLRYIRAGELIDAPILGAPSDVLVENQGGYLDVEVDPDFETNRMVYLSFSKGTRDENGTALVRGRLSDDATILEDVTQIFEFMPKKQRGLHFGGRIQFLPDGTLLLSLGDGFRWMDEAQNPDNHFGTIVRINSDGSVPDDNPFTDSAAPEVYSYGHRNVQGLAVDTATGTIYASEHGPKGGDEINILQPGNNYGWPVITYGVNYDGSVITNLTEKDGMEQPIVVWVPSIAPSALEFYSGDKYPNWTGDLFSSALAGSKIQRVDLESGTVVGEEALWEGDTRFRNIQQGPDGYLYLSTDDLDGSIFKLLVKEATE